MIIGSEDNRIIGLKFIIKIDESASTYLVALIEALIEANDFGLEKGER